MTMDAAAAPPEALSVFRRIGLALLVVGGLFLLAAVGVTVARIGWLARAHHADGLVTDIQRQASINGGLRTTMYRPVMTFTADDGRVITVNGSVWSSYTPYRPGDHVRLDYAPGRPGGAVMDDGVQRWFLTGFLLLLGAILTFIGAMFRMVSARGRER